MKNFTVVIMVAVVFAGGGFFGGMTYQKSQTPSLDAQREQFRAMMGRGGQGGPGGQGRFFGQGQGRPVAGEIIEKDDTSITVKLEDGSTKIIMLSKKTTINKAATGSHKDLKKGERVMAIGTENSDGSVTANMVQLGRFGFGRPQQGQ